MNQKLKWSVGWVVFAAAFTGPLVMFLYQGSVSGWFLTTLFLMFPGGYLIFDSQPAGTAPACHHRWQVCCDGLTDRQFVRCVVCDAEMPLP